MFEFFVCTHVLCVCVFLHKFLFDHCFDGYEITNDDFHQRFHYYILQFDLFSGMQTHSIQSFDSFHFYFQILSHIKLNDKSFLYHQVVIQIWDHIISQFTF